MGTCLFFEKTENEWIEELRALRESRWSEQQEGLTAFCKRLIAAAEEAGVSGHLWHYILTESLLMDENPYSLAAERKGAPGGTLDQLIRSEIERIFSLFHTDFEDMSRRMHVPEAELLCRYECRGTGKKYDPEGRRILSEAVKKMEECESPDEMLATLNSLYGKYGVGKLGMYGAFCLADGEEQSLQPIRNLRSSSLDDLVGYENQKKELMANTTAFLAGRPSNNCLLYGEAGTGKSTSIRGLLTEYRSRGLRIVEVSRHQYRQIRSLIESLSRRNYYFIIYLDDLSFEDFEVEYKYLKAVIEGGLQERPHNILIYATSNRRHLVKERFDDRPESPLDKHQNETVQEKLSLFDRFGTTIYYGSPDRKEYHNIVKALAKRHGIRMPEEELLAEADRFEMERNGLSGRTAEQLVDRLRGWELKGKQSDAEEAEATASEAEQITAQEEEKAAESPKEPEQPAAAAQGGVTVKAIGGVSQAEEPVQEGEGPGVAPSSVSVPPATGKLLGTASQTEEAAVKPRSSIFGSIMGATSAIAPRQAAAPEAATSAAPGSMPAVAAPAAQPSAPATTQKTEEQPTRRRVLFGSSGINSASSQGNISINARPALPANAMNTTPAIVVAEAPKPALPVNPTETNSRPRPLFGSRYGGSGNG